MARHVPLTYFRSKHPRLIRRPSARRSVNRYLRRIGSRAVGGIGQGVLVGMVLQAAFMTAAVAAVAVAMDGLKVIQA